MDKRKAVAKLKDTLKRTLKVFGWSPKLLSKGYAPGKWTARQILAHLTQCELVFLTRMHFILAEDNPPVVPFDQDAWMRRFDPAAGDVRPLRDSYRMLREVFIDIAKSASDADFARRARHPENPDYTLGYVVNYLAEHNERHLGQLDAIKAGRSWSAEVGG